MKSQKVLQWVIYFVALKYTFEYFGPISWANIIFVLFAIHFIGKLSPNSIEAERELEDGAIGAGVSEAEYKRWSPQYREWVKIYGHQTKPSASASSASVPAQK